MSWTFFHPHEDYKRIYYILSDKRKKNGFNPLKKNRIDNGAAWNEQQSTKSRYRSIFIIMLLFIN